MFCLFSLALPLSLSLFPSLSLYRMIFVPACLFVFFGGLDFKELVILELRSCGCCFAELSFRLCYLSLCTQNPGFDEKNPALLYNALQNESIYKDFANESILV